MLLNVDCVLISLQVLHLGFRQDLLQKSSFKDGSGIKLGKGLEKGIGLGIGIGLGLKVGLGIGLGIGLRFGLKLTELVCVCFNR